jgi:hypothetical protein
MSGGITTGQAGIEPGTEGLAEFAAFAAEAARAAGDDPP